MNFKDLNLQATTETTTLENGVVVKHYLPIVDKVDLASKVVNQASDDNGFCNPLRVILYLTLETVFHYTDVEFDEEDTANEFELYDTLVGSGFFGEVLEAIPTEEWNSVCDNIWEVIENIYKFNNSFVGALNAMTQDYNNLELDINSLQDNMRDPQNLALLKDVLSKLG